MAYLVIAAVIIGGVLAVVPFLIVLKRQKPKPAAPLVPSISEATKVKATDASPQEAGQVMAVPSTKFCRQCGATIPRDSRFCELCGATLA
jgi:hypothetical protein